MKKILFPLFAALLMGIACACDNATGIHKLSQLAESLGDSLTIKHYKDSLTEKLGSVTCEVSVEVDFPESGNPLLVNSIREWIFDQMAGNDSCDLNSMPDIIRMHNQETMAELKEMAIGDADRKEEMTYLDELAIRKTFENDRFVTFMLTDYCYMGGAHGSTRTIGATFRKTDGKLLDKGMLQDRGNKIDSVRTLIGKSLESYFEVNNWKDLKDQLIIDEYETAVPLPVSAPFIDRDSMVFLYQQYEIAPYAAGLPTAIIALQDLEGLFAPSFSRSLKATP